MNNYQVNKLQSSFNYEYSKYPLQMTLAISWSLWINNLK